MLRHIRFASREAVLGRPPPAPDDGTTQTTTSPDHGTTETTTSPGDGTTTNLDDDVEGVYGQDWSDMIGAVAMEPREELILVDSRAA